MSDEATVLYRPDRPAVVKPSREEIARKVCSCGQPEFHDPNQSVECDWTLACVSAVLALLPGRSERPAVVKPSVEDVARVMDEHSSVTSYDGGQTWQCDVCGDVKDEDDHPYGQILALLPGRSEREVLAQVWDEGAYEGWRHYAGSFAEVKERNPYRTDDRQEADRG